MMDLERRYTPSPVESRVRADSRTLGGYAAVFNRASQNLGGFVERVDPAFFNKARGDGWPDVLCRYNHDDNMLLGTSGGGTLRLRVDETGLDYEVDPPQARSDILELVQRGDVRKSSFAFRAFEEDWSVTDQDFPLRTLLSGQLVDVAPVNMPAYTDSTVSLRGLADKMGASLEEVRKLSDQNELRRFFVRTDKRGKPIPKAKPVHGPALLAELMGRAEAPGQ